MEVESLILTLGFGWIELSFPGLGTQVGLWWGLVRGDEFKLESTVVWSACPGSGDQETGNLGTETRKGMRTGDSDAWRSGVTVDC